MMDKEILETLQRLENKIDKIEIRQDETYQVVKALEHSTEVSKAEHDKITNDMAHIKGDVEAIRKDLTNVEIITSSNWNELAKLKAVK